jgi:hypothetical protein
MRSLLVIVFIPIVSCSSMEALAADSGAGLYQTHCASCHGAQLQVEPLVKQELIRIAVADNRAVLQEVLIPHIGRIRALAIGPNGEIYVALELAQEGVVVRLIPKS